jgi:peptide/nickel transport system substrate-binding protein
MRKFGSGLAVAALATFVAGAPAFAARGTDGELKILFWQAVSTLNPYLSGGVKEELASSLVLEPLAGFDEDAKLVPRLVVDIPTLENGGVSTDLTSVTWKLKPGVKWSDGSPLTADDVVFTWRYCTAPGGGCAQASKFEGVQTVEAIDPLTVKVTFTGPKPFPYTAFVGAASPIIQRAQFRDCLGPKAPGCTAANFAPVGTGPFKVQAFKPNDTISYAANDNYRDPEKPAFSTVTLKGGGDALSAARAVLETGEYDYAWNIQIEPEVLQAMIGAGKGKALTAFSSWVERIDVNLDAVDASLGDKRSTAQAGPHPILSDPAVRKALSAAIDRSVVVETAYGAAGKPTCNMVAGPDIYVSTANDSCLKPDLASVNKLLDDAGWKIGPDGVRAKNGVKLSFVFQTSTNSVRQATQAPLKDMWSQIGAAVELRNVPASVFFGGDPASPDTFQKFYSDLQMYTVLYEGTDPETYLARWLCKNIPSPSNGWQGENMSRYCDADYDRLIDALARTQSPAERATIVKKLNDKLVGDGVVIPLVFRGAVSAFSNRLAGIRMSGWDSELWNVADWSRAK